MMEFGELNITASRAFWDDYDNIDEEVPGKSVEVRWKWAKNSSIEDLKNVRNFIILEGERIRNQIAQNSTIVPTCHLFHQKIFISIFKTEGTAICVSEESNLNTFAAVAEEINELVKSSDLDVNVVTVNVLPISSYKVGTDEKLGGDVAIRGINSNTGSTVLELTEPNILTGVSAAVASYRHHLREPFSSYIIYTDSHKTNFIDAPKVLQFFEAVGISKSIFHEHCFSESSLYT